jgi:hypothetical protein
VQPRSGSKFINSDLYEEGVKVGFVKDDTSCTTKAYVKCCYYLPITCIGVMLFYFLYLCLYNRPLCLALLTVYMIHHSYCYLFHVTLFSWVGQKRMRKAELVNYRELYDERLEQMAREGKELGPDELAWEDVVHFVILPNYKEDIDILREAIDTLAISTIAREQMGIVLAMEARESGSREKAEELLEEYSPRFKWAMAAYHPKGLPNEMPGKASNTRWAAQRLWEFIEDPSSGIDEHKVNEFVAAKPGQQSVTYLTTRSIVVLEKKKKK